MALAHTTAGLIREVSRVGQHKIGYTVLTVLVFFASVSLLAVLDLLPERKEAALATAPVVEAVDSANVAPELPVRVEIPSIKLATVVANPESTEVSVLDNALHDGAVRYPRSSKLGEAGNVIVFGHSSYLPVVNNPAYKTFNEIQKLKSGDQILVIGETHTFVYAVETVNSANAGTDAIPLTVSGSVLTLATCDSFGKASSRFIVTAKFVESYPNAS